MKATPKHFHSQEKAKKDREARKKKSKLKKAEKAREKQNLPAALSKGKALFQGQLHPKKLKKIVRIEQWVEVRVRDGVVTTTLYPSNEKLIQRGQRMLPPPEYVYRRINFPDGIPDVYNWVGVRDESHRKFGGLGIQRMTVDTWLEVIEEEANDSSGHIHPVGNLPRPRESGGCQCETCKHNQKILDDRAATAA